MLKNIVIVVSSIVICLVILAIAVSCGSSDPAYVSHLKSDGFPVANQHTLTGGEGVGYAWGCNSGGNGEIVMEAKSDTDAQSVAQTIESNGVAAIVQGDLVSVQAPCDGIQAFLQGAGWN